MKPPTLDLEFSASHSSYRLRRKPPANLVRVLLLLLLAGLLWFLWPSSEKKKDLQIRLGRDAAGHLCLLDAEGRCLPPPPPSPAARSWEERLRNPPRPQGQQGK